MPDMQYRSNSLLIPAIIMVKDDNFFIISFIALEFFKPDSMKLQGGFARCYELTDMDTKQLFAGKIVAKTLLQKQHQKDKVLK